MLLGEDFPVVVSSWGDVPGSNNKIIIELQAIIDAKKTKYRVLCTVSHGYVSQTLDPKL